MAIVMRTDIATEVVLLAFFGFVFPPVLVFV